MSTKRYKPEQVVTLLRQIEVEVTLRKEIGRKVGKPSL